MGMAKRYGVFGLMLVVVLAALVLGVSVVAGQGAKDPRNDEIELPDEIEDYDDCEDAIEELLKESEGLDFRNADYIIKGLDFTAGTDSSTSGQWQIESLGQANGDLIACASINLQSPDDSGYCSMVVHRQYLDEIWDGQTNLGYWSTGINFYSAMDQASGEGVSVEVKQSLSESIANDPQYFLLVIHDGYAWVYYNGELITKDGIIVFTDEGTADLTSNLSNLDSQCVYEDVTVYGTEE